MLLDTATHRSTCAGGEYTIGAADVSRWIGVDDVVVVAGGGRVRVGWRAPSTWQRALVAIGALVPPTQTVVVPLYQLLVDADDVTCGDDGNTVSFRLPASLPPNIEDRALAAYVYGREMTAFSPSHRFWRATATVLWLGCAATLVRGVRRSTLRGTPAVKSVAAANMFGFVVGFMLVPAVKYGDGYAAARRAAPFTNRRELAGYLDSCAATYRATRRATSWTRPFARLRALDEEWCCRGARRALM